MRVLRFDPDEDLILVKARVFGKQGRKRLLLALDTAASHTHITPDIIDELGYSPREGEALTSVTSAIGREAGYMLRVRRFESLGFGFDDFLVHVHDLPAGIGIDGLLGLSFLKQFNYEIRSAEGRILVERVAGR